MRARPNVDMDKDEIKQAVDALANMDISNIMREGRMKDIDISAQEFALNAVELAKGIQQDNYYFSDSSYYEFTDGFDTDDDDFMDHDLVQQVMRARPNIDMDKDEIKQAVDALANMDISNIMGEGSYGKKKVTKEPKPDFPDVDGDGNTKEPISQASDDAEEEKVNEDHDKYDDAQELYNENGVKVMAYNFAGDSSQFEIYINDEALVDGIKVGDTFHVEGKEYTEVADLVDDYSSLEEGQNYEIKDGEVHISRSDFRRVHKDFKNDEAGNERMSALDPDSGATTSYPVRFAG
jgi:ribosomal protein L12E/L44/L45/RPP1/RPP2